MTTNRSSRPKLTREQRKAMNDRFNEIFAPQMKAHVRDAGPMPSISTPAPAPATPAKGHDACSHESTKAARAACRKARNI